MHILTTNLITLPKRRDGGGEKGWVKKLPTTYYLPQATPMLRPQKA
jgi:hypothetical protein